MSTPTPAGYLVLKCLVLNVGSLAHNAGTILIHIKSLSLQLLGEIDLFIIIKVESCCCQDIIYNSFRGFLG